MRVPSRARRGTPDDVPSMLPILAELSSGALRGVPAWVPSPAPRSTEITRRKRSASWLEITYPFSTDAEIRDRYMVSDGEGLRAGMFLEELDAFSADCSMRHADGYNPLRPLTVVTAAHDGLSIFGGDGLHSPLSAKHDLRLRGAVVSVGTSSMEVRTDLLRVLRTGEPDDRWSFDAPYPTNDVEQYLGSCFTVMVARDGRSFGKAAIHQLLGGDAQSDEENRAAARRASLRRSLAANALALKPPSTSEVPILHELWRSTRDGLDGDGGRTASSSSASNSGGGSETPLLPMATSEQRALDIMQPAHRNMNGFMVRRQDDVP